MPHTGPKNGFMFEPEISFISSTLDTESNCKNAIENMGLNLESTSDC